MTLRDVLVHVEGTTAGRTRLRLAVDLAHRHGAQLAALHVEGRSDHQLKVLRSAELGLLPADKLVEVERQIVRQNDESASQLRQTLEALGDARGLITEWRSVSGAAVQVLPQHARYADLTVVGHGGPEADDDRHGYSFAEMMLFTVGRPIIIVPPEVLSTTLGRRIAIAWNSSRPAARAVADALPLVEMAMSTTVLTVNSESIERPGAPPQGRLVEHLRKHGGKVTATTLRVDHGSIGDTLQLQALASDADLLVAGAYGHPRIWENLLGGVTRDLLARQKMPILMST